MPGLTELPSTDAASLGATRKDLRTFKGEEHRASARLLNKIRVYLIQIGEQLGLGDGSTAGSLQQAVNDLALSATSNVIWKYDGTLSSFSDNPLPDPGLQGGVSVDVPTLTLGTGDSPSRLPMLLGADEMVSGAAIWWVDDVIPFGDMYARWSVSYPSAFPADGEAIGVGIVYAADTDGLYVYDIVEFANVGDSLVVTRRVVSANAVDAVNVVMYESVVNGGYIVTSTLDIRATRDGDSYGPPGPGTLTGTANITTSAFVPGGLDAPASATGAVLVYSSDLSPVGEAWSTSACNRVGVILTGEWTNAGSGRLSCQMSNIEFLRVHT